MKKLTIVLGAVVAVALSACTSLSDEFELHKQGTSELTQISQTTYQYRLNQPWQQSYMKFKETLFDFTTEFCGKREMGAQLLDYYSKNLDKGMDGTIVFRCVKRMAPPTAGLIWSNNSESNN